MMRKIGVNSKSEFVQISQPATGQVLCCTLYCTLIANGNLNSMTDYNEYL